MTHTTEPTKVQQPPTTGSTSTRSPRHLLHSFIAWAAIAVGLITASVLVVLTVTFDPAVKPVQTPQSPTGSAIQQRPAGAPMSADGAERYLAQHGTNVANRQSGVPMSADGAERYLAQHGTNLATRPAGVPMSADGQNATSPSTAPTAPPGPPAFRSRRTPPSATSLTRNRPSEGDAGRSPATKRPRSVGPEPVWMETDRMPGSMPDSRRGSRFARSHCTPSSSNGQPVRSERSFAMSRPTAPEVPHRRVTVSLCTHVITGSTESQVGWASRPSPCRCRARPTMPRSERRREWSFAAFRTHPQR